MANMNKEEKGNDAVIIVNGEEKTVASRTVTFEQVTQLAYPGSDEATTFTVLFYKAEDKKEGSMVEGDAVKVHKEGSSFNVTRSVRS